MMQKTIKKIFSIAFVFLMILPVILTPYANSHEAQIPSLSIGSRWKYKVEYYDPGTGTVTMNGTTIREIIGESNVTVDTITYNCFVEKIEGSWKDQNVVWTMNGTVYRVKSDLNTIKEDMKVTLKVGGEVALDQISNVTYNPPLKELNFPLTEGKNWTVSVNKTETVILNGEPPDTKTTHVARNYTISKTTARVTVGAGTFDAFVISYRTSDTVYEQYYSSAAGDSVMELVKRRSDERLMIKTGLIETNLIPPSSQIEWWVWLAIAIGVIVVAGVVVFFIRVRKPFAAAGVPKMALAHKFNPPFFLK